MTRRKTPEEYLQECKDKGLDLPLEEYKNADLKIKHRCNKGHIYEQTPSVHLRGHGCPECAKIKTLTNLVRKHKTPEEYYNECKSKGLDLPIEDYKGCSIKIKHKCSQGHVYLQSPNSHLNGRNCPKCSRHYSYTPDEYYQRCKKKSVDLPIEDYRKATIPIKHKCSQGHVYLQAPYAHVSLKQGCPKCNGGIRYSETTYYNLGKSKGLDLPIEEYVTATARIKHKCRKGHIYEQRPDTHLQGRGCPICKESRGERFIRAYLNKHKIKYESQKKFGGLIDNKPLSYDFFLPNYSILIEYQGEQHFKEVSFGNKCHNLDKQKYHDRIKQRFAKENGYRLLRPTYKTNTQEKINRYLDRYLLKTLDK